MEGVILTGGQSRRMGRDKKDLIYREESFIRRIRKSLFVLDRV